METNSTKNIYASRKRRKPSLKSVKECLVETAKSNPSKRHRDRLNSELDRLASLLPFHQDVIAKMDKLTVLRLSVGCLRAKSHFNTVLKSNSSNQSANDDAKTHIQELPEGQLLLQAVNGFVLAVTSNATVFYVSSTVQDYLGFHQTDIIHQSFYDFIHTEDRAEFHRQLHWALNRTTSSSDPGQLVQAIPDSQLTQTFYNLEQLPPEDSPFLERNFMCRLRCLQNSSSGFLTVNFQGRLKFLYGQNGKTHEGKPIPPQLALFALVCPVQPPILEIRAKSFIFRTKHKLDFTPIACDAKGTLVLGYTEAELCYHGSGYQFIHAADMLHCAENHIRMMKTGETGLTVFRLLTKQSRWVWLQSNARLIYKNGRPDFIIASQRVLMDEEGEETLKKRSLLLPFSFTTGEAVLYDICLGATLSSPESISSVAPGDSNQLKIPSGLDPNSLLGSMLKQDTSIYRCPSGSEEPIRAQDPEVEEEELGGIFSSNWQKNIFSLPATSLFKPDSGVGSEEGESNCEIMSLMGSLGITPEDVKLLQQKELFLNLELDGGYGFEDFTDGVLSYVQGSLIKKEEFVLPGNIPANLEKNCLPSIVSQPQPSLQPPLLSQGQQLQSLSFIEKHSEPKTQQFLLKQSYSQPQQSSVQTHQGIQRTQSHLSKQLTSTQPGLQLKPQQQSPHLVNRTGLYQPDHSCFFCPEREVNHRLNHTGVKGSNGVSVTESSSIDRQLSAVLQSDLQQPKSFHLKTNHLPPGLPYMNQLNTVSMNCNLEFAPTSNSHMCENLEDLLTCLNTVVRSEAFYSVDTKATLIQYMAALKKNDDKGKQKYVVHRPLRRAQSDAAVIQREYLYPVSLPAESYWSYGTGVSPCTMDVKPEVPLVLETLSPLDLRTDVRMPAQTSDTNVWERQMQQELLLIQKQQQIQKQLLINEFQKQHENLIRQHQVQLQEHLKLQQELQVMKQQQEQLEKERKLEQQNQERELERHRRQQQALILRSKERARENAMASTEVKQKLQEFLLNKSTKDTTFNGSCPAFTHNSKLWFTASHHTSLEQSSPPLGGVSPSCQFPLPSLPDCRDDFPLRKTASEPNLKVRSRLKQKVAERRSSPLLRRKEGTVITPFKKRALELMESTATSSSTGSGPSSPNRASSFPGSENGPSPLLSSTYSEFISSGRSSESLPDGFMAQCFLVPLGLRYKAVHSGACGRNDKSLSSISLAAVLFFNSTVYTPMDLQRNCSPGSYKGRISTYRSVNMQGDWKNKQGCFRADHMLLDYPAVFRKNDPMLVDNISPTPDMHKNYQFIIIIVFSRWPSQPKLLGSEGSLSMLSLYTSPSLPNITLGLSAASSPISAGESSGVLPVRQGLPAQLLGPLPLPVNMESKVSSSQQALLQHLLQKEQLRQQKIFSTGQSAGSVHPPSPLAMTERSSGSSRPKLPRHRPLNRTQSAPLPQSLLAQLVIQQQHQHFLEKQKQYQQQVHINKLFSKTMEQLRQPHGHLHESNEEEREDVQDHVMQEDSSPSSGVIRKCSPRRQSSNSSIHSRSLLREEAAAHTRVIRIKQESADSDDETHAKESLAEKKSAYLHQVEGRLGTVSKLRSRPSVAQFSAWRLAHSKKGLSRKCLVEARNPSDSRAQECWERTSSAFSKVQEANHEP
ncbi:Aryl hydrocarbon receptor [Bagarius yarrelli]|uniref:histone deacetylase n=1 Tax=Bagarius yarrelli TaxID=175774 RepID=A0A556TPW5_BAGYA|nr:Aryl hydrocarbon receptor [Bagarius yarrelli]